MSSSTRASPTSRSRPPPADSARDDRRGAQCPGAAALDAGRGAGRRDQHRAARAAPPASPRAAAQPAHVVLGRRPDAVIETPDPDSAIVHRKLRLQGVKAVVEPVATTAELDFGRWPLWGTPDALLPEAWDPTQQEGWPSPDPHHAMPGGCAGATGSCSSGPVRASHRRADADSTGLRAGGRLVQEAVRRFGTGVAARRARAGVSSPPGRCCECSRPCTGPLPMPRSPVSATAPGGARRPRAGGPRHRSRRAGAAAAQRVHAARRRAAEAAHRGRRQHRRDRQRHGHGVGRRRPARRPGTRRAPARLEGWLRREVRTAALEDRLDIALASATRCWRRRSWPGRPRTRASTSPCPPSWPRCASPSSPSGRAAEAGTRQLLARPRPRCGRPRAAHMRRMLAAGYLGCSICSAFWEEPPPDDRAGPCAIRHRIASIGP